MFELAEYLERIAFVPDESEFPREQLIRILCSRGGSTTSRMIGICRLLVVSQ